MTERKIVIGLITSTDYLRQIRHLWDIRYIESATAKRLAGWCWEHFDKYDHAPGKDIENIYYTKLKETRLSKTIAEEIENEILPSLSKEYEKEAFNLNYYIKETEKYFKERSLTLLASEIQGSLDTGQVLQAEQLALNYKPIASAVSGDLNLGDTNVLERVDKAFQEAAKPIIRYPGALGDFWNAQLVRGGFVALMGPEKRGKTFWLLDLSMRACKQGCKVAFFQAGDMTEDQQLRRICIYLARKSDKEKYIGEQWEPTKDCVHNQLDNCDRKERECSFGVFDGMDEKELRNSMSRDALIEAFNKNKRYTPCFNCQEYATQHWGTVWLNKVEVKNILRVEEAKNVIKKFFLDNNRDFKLSSHANGTLTVKQIRAILANWEKKEEFVPDVIVVDYADLLSGENKDFRHLQNEIWKGLRSLSQEKDSLVITATQADSRSYEQDSLKLTNFSEDKRKYAHVTAMYGLNQDRDSREKKIGIMRINELVVREDDFATTNQVTVLQNLRRGRPFLGSYW